MFFDGILSPKSAWVGLAHEAWVEAVFLGVRSMYSYKQCSWLKRLSQSSFWAFAFACYGGFEWIIEDANWLTIEGMAAVAASWCMIVRTWNKIMKVRRTLWQSCVIARNTLMTEFWVAYLCTYVKWILQYVHFIAHSRVESCNCIIQ